MAKRRSFYKPGDILFTKAGMAITIKLIFYCNGCKEDHYQLHSKINGIYSHPASRIDKAHWIVPPTPAGQVLYGHS